MTSTPKQVLDVLEMLSDYYSHEPTVVQANIYLELLSDLHPAVLKESAYLWMSRSPFFPKVSELLKTAREVPVPRPDYLANRVQSLEDDFYADRTLDPFAWLVLVEAFEQANRPHRALHTRQKFEAFQGILERESKLSAPNDPEPDRAEQTLSRSPDPKS